MVLVHYMMSVLRSDFLVRTCLWSRTVRRMGEYGGSSGDTLKFPS